MLERNKNMKREQSDRDLFEQTGGECRLTITLDDNNVVSDAATPWSTLHAALSRDIQSNENTRFAKRERGRFGLQ
jgi:hypothetical protein